MISIPLSPFWVDQYFKSVFQFVFKFLPFDCSEGNVSGVMSGFLAAAAAEGYFGFGNEPGIFWENPTPDSLCSLRIIEKRS